ncbi:MAG: sigma-70 family RNA polymerase sigma factor [Sumerlaeia bacterium]
MAAELSDVELVQKAQRGERAALEQLTERYYSSVYAVALSQLRDGDAADDLAQEVFLRATLNLGALRDGSRYGAWVIRMTRNLARDWQRRGNTRSRLLPLVPLDDELSATVREHAPDPRQRMIHDDEHRELNEAVWRLPERQREIVLMHYQEGLDQKVIAERLGVHPSTVSRQLEKSLAMMRDDMDSRMRQALAPRKATPRMVRRAAAVAVVTASLSGEAKAAVVAAAASKSALAASSAETAASSGLGIWAFLQSLGATCASGVTTMGLGKSIAVAAVAITLTGGTVYYAQNHDQFNQSAAMQNAGDPKNEKEFRAMIPGAIVTAQGQFGVPKSIHVPFGTGAQLIYPEGSHPQGVKDLYVYAPGPAEGTHQFVTLQNGEHGYGKAPMDGDYQSFMELAPEPVGYVQVIILRKDKAGINLYYHDFMNENFGKVQTAVRDAYRLGQISEKAVYEALIAAAEKEGLFPANAQDVEGFKKALRNEVSDFLMNPPSA